jgi:hypothetical protein
VRPKYKALYESEQARLRRLQDRLDNVSRERDRMRAVLVDHAERVVLPRLQQLAPIGEGEIELEPLDFVAYEQTLLAMTRFTQAEEESSATPRQLAWRGRRVTTNRKDI